MASESGVVVWFTGLPSSGKSTLARRVAAELAALGAPGLILDGDELRACLVPAPGYDAEGRDAFYATLANLAALLAQQGQIVLVAATAHLRRYREHARSIAPAFVEVHVDTPPEECRRRDAKGLYRQAEVGGANTLPGKGALYEEPAAPEARLHGEEGVPALVELIRASAPA